MLAPCLIVTKHAENLLLVRMHPSTEHSFVFTYGTCVRRANDIGMQPFKASNYNAAFVQ